MPTSDAILFVIGLADYVFILAFVAITGFVVSRKEHQETESSQPHSQPESETTRPLKARIRKEA